MSGRTVVIGSDQDAMKAYVERQKLINDEYDRQQLCKILRVVLHDRFMTATKADDFKTNFANAIKIAPGAFSMDMIFTEHRGTDYGMTQEDWDTTHSEYRRIMKKFDEEFLAKYQFPEDLCKELDGDASDIIEEYEGEILDIDMIQKEYYERIANIGIDFLLEHKIPEAMWGIDICYDTSLELLESCINSNDNTRILRAVGVNLDFNPAALKY